MGSDITWIKLKELTTKIGSGATPRGGSKVYIDKGIHLIRSQNVYNDGFSNDGLVCISDRHAEELSNVEVQEDDVLLNITGASVGRSCQVPNEILPARVNQHVAIIRPDQNKLDPLYLRYFLISSRMQEMIFSYASAGATRQALTKGMIENFEIPIIPLEEQRRIGRILYTFDKKVLINQEINASLEAIARAIFKSWFVDFDPVRAKMAGEPYPLPDAVMALFSDELVESELGMIPKGWDVKRLENITSITDCLHSKKPNQLSEGKLLLQVYNIGENGELDLSEEYYISDQDYTNWIRRFEASPGDIIISKTGRVGAVAQIPRNFYAAIGRNLVGIRANKDYINEEFLRDLMSSNFMENEIIQKTSLGTILKSIHVKHIATLRAIIPSKQLVDIYSDYLKPVHDIIENNNYQTSILAHQRDELISEIF